MPLAEELLTPIQGANRAGESLRNTPVFEKIKDARTSEEELPAGDWERERKTADYGLVIRLAQEAITTKSKDLQLTAWLTEALLHRDGYSGLRSGLELCISLIEQYWDSLYPEPDDGDLEIRAAPLNWIGLKLESALKRRPLVAGKYDWFTFKESRAVGYESQAESESQREKRAALLAEGKVSAEDFDKAFADTPKAFYRQAEADLDGCLAALQKLNDLCDEKFGDAAPSFTTLRKAIEEVRHSVHSLLERKRESEPDPVEAVHDAVASVATPAAQPKTTSGPATLVIPLGSSEPADRRDAIAAIAAQAAFLRKREPFSPAPYLLMRGLRWGEIRAAAESSDTSWLEAPPTEVRRHIKSLALEGKWSELIEAAENIMSLPCSRAWLDLQRFVVDACVELGPQYHGIARAIRSELRSLLRDVPQLLNATLMDDTPAANPATQAWIQELVDEPAAAASEQPSMPSPSHSGTTNGTGAWKTKLRDSYTVAMEALNAGNAAKAFEVLSNDIANQRSGRGRFQRRLQLVELCIATGKIEIAQPILDDLVAAIEAHKLDDWEEPALVARALQIILKSSRKVQDSSSEQAALFERICRLDVVRAMEL